MIRATAATWMNYATTLIFQVVFAAKFGATAQAGAYVVAFAAAVALAGVFITTAVTIGVPRMLDDSSGIRRPTLTFFGVLAVLVLLTAGVVGLASQPLGALIAPMFGVSMRDMTLLILCGDAFLAATAIAGILGGIALARGRRFLPAVAPALPTSLGASYLLLAATPGVIQTLAVVAAGALAQMAVMTGVAVFPFPTIKPSPYDHVGRIAALTAALLAFTGLLQPLQRLVAAVGDPAGTVRFDYAFRSTMVAQQLLIGGLLIAVLPDWTARHRRSIPVARDVLSTTLAVALLLVTAATIALVIAPVLTAFLFERGAFTAADTGAVALLVRALLVGFVAEGAALVMAQGIVAVGRNDLALRLGYGRLGIQVFLTLILGLTMGQIGVAIAYSVSMLAAAGYATVLAARLFLLQTNGPLFMRSLAAWLLIALVGVAVVVTGSIPPLLAAFLILLLAVGVAFALGLGGLFSGIVGRAADGQVDAAFGGRT